MSQEQPTPEIAGIAGSDLRINPLRGTLILWLSISGRYRAAIDLGETCLAEMQGKSDSLHPNLVAEWAHSHVGLGHAYAALGRTSDAATMFTVARAAYQSVNHHAMESNTLVWKLLYLHIPYHTDQVTERRALAAAAEAIWARASGATPSEAMARVQQLPVLVLDGNWKEASDLALHGRQGVTNTARHLQLMGHLGTIARHRGDAKLAWAQVRAGLPDGPATQPGNCFFHLALLLIRLGADLALDEGNIDTAHSWIEAHDTWLDWSGIVLGRRGWSPQLGRIPPGRRRVTNRPPLCRGSDPKRPRILDSHLSCWLPCVCWANSTGMKAAMKNPSSTWKNPSRWPIPVPRRSNER